MGYWPSVRSRWLDIGQVLFLRVYRDRDEVRSINSQKTTRPISSHLDRTNLVNKGFIIWLLGKFCLRDSAGSPERARLLHLARSGSQSQRAISFILPARGGSHIISQVISLATCLGYTLYKLSSGVSRLHNSTWWNRVLEPHNKGWSSVSKSAEFTSEGKQENLMYTTEKAHPKEKDWSWSRRVQENWVNDRKGFIVCTMIVKFITSFKIIDSVQPLKWSRPRNDP